MSRPSALAAVLLLLVGGSAALAQVPEAQSPAEEPGSYVEQLPDFAGRIVSGEAVVDLADFISGCLAEVGGIPDFAQVQTADGRLRGISAAQAFVLLARTAYLWQVTGQLPETVPIAPEDPRPPILDAEDIPAPEAELSVGQEVPTELFLSQCNATVQWVDRLHVVPTAVWVDGERLSAAQYLAGLAICIQYAYWEEELLEYLFLPAYFPPDSWARNAAEQPGGAGAEMGEEQAEEWPSSAETVWEEAPPEEPPASGLPLLAGPPQVPAAARPQLTLFPSAGATLSGVADLVASYSGPPARFVTFAIDGETRVILNLPPYSYRWDTSGLPPGTHTVRVQVLGEGEAVIADQINGFVIVPPEAPEVSDATLRSSDPSLRSTSSVVDEF